MKLLVCLVVCSHLFNSVLNSPIDKSFDIDLQKNSVISENVTSFEEKLSSLQQKMSSPIASNSTSYHNTTSDPPPQKSCKAWFELGFTTNAVYNLDYGSNPAGIKVWCDMENGGYTVLLKRYDGSEPFNRPWSEYRTGFGKRDSEYWIGLEYIYQLSQLQNTKLRIEMKRFTEETIYYAEYSNFYIDDEASYYKLHYGDYSGNAGNGFSDSIHEMRFSTYDQDHDLATYNCASQEGGSGGWWFNRCSPASLTGRYSKPGEYEFRNELYWQPLTGNEESLEMVEMKIY